MLDELRDLVREVFEEINERRSEPIPLSDVLEISLYGEEGVFDSMHLVGFLALLEEKLEDRFDLEVSLTSEKAVSRRASPFASVPNLLAFIEEEARELGVEVGV